MSSIDMDVKKIVKEKYGQAAAQAESGARSCLQFFQLLQLRGSYYEGSIHLG